MQSSAEAYRQAGVDLDRAEEVVAIARRAAALTRTPDVSPSIGGFSGAFELPACYRQPVLLTACDGVGTKLKLAMDAHRYDTVGIDLVAMSVNDILVNGGQPLVFLDYLATSRIDPAQTDALLQGIAEGCRQAGCALVGGETAEMPGFYKPEEFDLAGFCVGVAEKENLLPRLHKLQPGDRLIGLLSSGCHSNGYSLVRKLMADSGIALSDCPAALNGMSVGEALLTPTRIYVQPVLALLKALPGVVNAMVHVTGGGFYDNIPRILPEGLGVSIDSSAWAMLPVLQWLQETGKLDPPTLWHTFNAGIGMILVVPEASEAEVLTFLQREQPTWGAVRIGVLENNPATANRERVMIR
ncbi:MAG: phosphoribosylformylglycinamidine cyclo-ligase [Candidatus Melainabacteria bacterium]